MPMKKQLFQQILGDGYECENSFNRNVAVQREEECDVANNEKSSNNDTFAMEDSPTNDEVEIQDSPTGYEPKIEDCPMDDMADIEDNPTDEVNKIKDRSMNNYGTEKLIPDMSRVMAAHRNLSPSMKQILIANISPSSSLSPNISPSMKQVSKMVQLKVYNVITFRRGSLSLFAKASSSLFAVFSD